MGEGEGREGVEGGEGGWDGGAGFAGLRFGEGGVGNGGDAWGTVDSIVFFAVGLGVVVVLVVGRSSDGCDLVVGVIGLVAGVDQILRVGAECEGVVYDFLNYLLIQG